MAVVNKYTDQIVAMFDCKQSSDAKRFKGLNKNLKLKKVRLMKVM